MKIKNYMLFALAALGLATSCENFEWDTPAKEKAMSAWGNKYLQENNLKTIAEVKALYSEEIKSNSLKLVTTPMQIKCTVVGNDEGGNIYNTLYVQDQTGAIAISIAQSGLYGPLAVGQCLLIELKGLFVGAYNNLPEIGDDSFINDDGTFGLGKMSRFIWQEHFKLISTSPELVVTPLEVYNNLNTLSFEKDCCKLITLKDVELSSANGKATFTIGNITGDDREIRNGKTKELTAVTRGFKGVGSNTVLYASTSADFANNVMPQGKVEITGIASRHKDTWQILMRTAKDIKPSNNN